MPTSPSRRAVLAALSATVAVALAGCSTPWGRLRVQPLDGDPPPSPLPPGADELAVASAAAAVSAVLGRVGELGASLADPLREALGEQLTALGEQVPSASPTATPTAGTTTTTANPTGGGDAQPDGLPAAQQVADLLDAAAGAASADVAAVAGGTARLLACVSAGAAAAAAWTRGAGGAPASSASAPPPSASSSSPSSSSSSSSSPSGPTPTATAAALSGEQEALATALAVEEAAQYGYGVLAVRLAGGQRDAATADLAVHADLVELLRDELQAQGAEPPAPQPAWALPSPVADAGGALALAQQLEGASAAAWADVVAAADRERRAAATSQLARAALRWQAWRAAAAVPGLVALPGLSGR